MYPNEILFWFWEWTSYSNGISCEFRWTFVLHFAVLIAFVYFNVVQCHHFVNQYYCYSCCTFMLINWTDTFIKTFTTMVMHLHVVEIFEHTTKLKCDDLWVKFSTLCTRSYISSYLTWWNLSKKTTSTKLVVTQSCVCFWNLFIHLLSTSGITRPKTHHWMSYFFREIYSYDALYTNLLGC